eukprot:Nk52_evm53s2039 gene=Nk52_evmTU53s2039
MNFVGRVFSGVKEFYKDINPATLSGALDIVVVEQEDGSFTTSPFHVRFGKMSIFASKEKVVGIEVNGEPTDLFMKLGEAGEAFFVLESAEKVPKELLTSPLASPGDADYSVDDIEPFNLDDPGAVPVPPQQDDAPKGRQRNSESFSGANVADRFDSEDEEVAGALAIGAKSEPNSPLPGENSTSDAEHMATLSTSPWQWGWGGLPGKSTNLNSDGLKAVGNGTVRPVLDGDGVGDDFSTRSIDGSALDSEYNPQIDEKDVLIEGVEGETGTGRNRQSWMGRMGNIMKLFRDKQDPLSEGGVYLDDLDEEEADRYLEKGLTKGKEETSSPAEELQFGGDMDEVEDLDTSSSRKETTAKLTKEALNRSMEKLASTSQTPGHRASRTSLRTAANNRISFAGSVRSNVSYVSTQTPAGRAGSNSSGSESGLALEEKQLDTVLEISDFDRDIDSFPGLAGGIKVEGDGSVEEGNEIAVSLCGQYFDNSSNTEMASKFAEHQLSFEQFDANPNLLADPNLVIRVFGRYYNWKVAGPMIASLVVFQRPLSVDTMKILTEEHMPKKGAKDSEGWRSWWFRTSSFSSSDGQPLLDAPDRRISNHASSPLVTGDSTNYFKSLRLPSDQIKKLNLSYGANTITFTIATKLQGTAKCTSNIFLWKWNSKVVISDVDGTITKSDALGHILPALGKDWTHSGVTQLYTAIRKNGYHILYLSSRAIGQADITRGFLRGVKQGEATLPAGPILLSPDRLLTSFHREVIRRKPDEFKIACLSDIRDLFPSDQNCFYAGFGNRPTDSISYQAVGVPQSRQFIINPSGEVKVETLNTYQSSYVDLAENVDSIFPNINDDYSDECFNDFNYWKQELPSIDVISTEASESSLKQESKSSES